MSQVKSQLGVEFTENEETENGVLDEEFFSQLYKMIEDKPYCKDNLIEELNEKYLLQTGKLQSQDTSMARFVIITNIPVVDASKKDKLLTVIEKYLGKINIKPLSVEMPFDESENTSQGLIFLEMEDNIKALIAVDILNNREFDKKHVMSACIAEDFDLINDFAYQNVEELPQHTADKNNDLNCTYLLSQQHEGTVKALLNGISQDKTITEMTKIIPEVDEEILSIRYSPNGLYLIKQHEHFIDCMYGPCYANKIRLNTGNIDQFIVSSGERYLITFTSNFELRQSAVAVWDIYTQIKLRTFSTDEIRSAQDESSKIVYNFAESFSFSCNDEFLVRISSDKLSVQSMPDVAHVRDVNDQLQALQVNYLMQAAFSPTLHTVVYYTLSTDHNHVSKICLIDPAKKLKYEVPKKEISNPFIRFDKTGCMLAFASLNKSQKKIELEIINLVELRKNRITELLKSSQQIVIQDLYWNNCINSLRIILKVNAYATNEKDKDPKSVMFMFQEILGSTLNHLYNVEFKQDRFSPQNYQFKGTNHKEFFIIHNSSSMFIQREDFNLNSGFEVIFETNYKNILNIDIDYTGKFIGVTAAEGVIKQTVKFDIQELNGFIVKSFETRCEDIASKETKDETNAHKTQLLFTPVHVDQFNLRYTNQIKQNPEVKEWIEGEDIVVEKRLNEIKEINAKKKASYVDNMLSKKNILLEKIKN